MYILGHFVHHFLHLWKRGESWWKNGNSRTPFFHLYLFCTYFAYDFTEQKEGVVFSQNIHWFKKTLNYDDLKCTRTNITKQIFIRYMHHGWRKFWIMTITRNKDRKDFSYKISSPCLTKILNFATLKWVETKILD